MKKSNKIPIIGEEFYCETVDGEKNGNHLILLAKNQIGYKNLIKLSSLSYESENFYKKPHITYDMLKKYHEGIICTSACIGGEIPQLIINGGKNSHEKFLKSVNFFKNTFGDDFYFEIQRHGIKDEDKVNNVLLQLGKRYNIKVVCTTDSHYVLKEDSKAHEVILCMSTGKKLSDPNRMRFEGTGYHLHNADEIESLFSDCMEVVDNTIDILSKCEDIKFGPDSYLLPEYPLPKGFNNEYDYLKKISRDGFKQRFSLLFSTDGIKDEAEIKRRTKLKKTYWERYKYELEIIKNMGFCGYFLIVWDFLKFARDNDIPIGPGRGSGAGSMVLYCLGITDIDPIKYGLLFERFLNPSRISMPDIDSDISEQKRDKVIEYVSQMYGIDHVSYIVTHNNLKAKLVLRDVMRVYEIPQSEVNAIIKLLPANVKCLSDAIKDSEFSKKINSNSYYKEIFNIATKLEGLPKNRSIHACGIIIAPGVVSNYCPQLSLPSSTGERKMCTQFNMSECEEIKLLKMDFLGLRTLDVIDYSTKLINSEFGTNYNIFNIPINDPKVYKFLSTGHTSGVFQFESDGMTNLLKKMYTDVRTRDDDDKKGEEYFERLIAAVSLYRPGPMDEIPNFIKAMKTGNIEYDHKKLESILNNTYGILVYQEQIMFAVRELAGFSASQADTIRKAMGKKKIKIMNEYENYFIYGSADYDKHHPDDTKKIKGCIHNGISESVAKTVWNKMTKFAEYAFNKSHATCYASIGVKTAWLSCYYPAEFMSGILNSYIGKTDKIRRYILACKDRKIGILPPDINQSDLLFTVKKSGRQKNIIFGLAGITGVGDVAAKIIVEERTKHGPFKDLLDFLKRTAKNIDKSVIEALIYTGAFDCFGYTRASLIDALPKIDRIASNIRKNNEMQLTFFDFFDEEKYKLDIQDMPELSKYNLSKKEQEYLGLMINHPILDYKEKFDEWKSEDNLIDIADVLEQFEHNHELEKVDCRIAGVVLNKETKSYVNKHGKRNQFVRFDVDDGTGYVKTVAFGTDFLKYNTLLNEGSVVYILGTIVSDEFGYSLKIEKLCKLK